MLELAERGELSAERSVTLARLTLRFVGNASVQVSRERRKRAIEEMNGKLVELADKDTIYEEAPPMLFGDRFAKEAKEREDQLRALDRATGRSQFQRPQNFYNRPQGFRRGHEPEPSRHPVWDKGTLSALSIQSHPRKRKLHPEGNGEKPVQRRRTERVTSQEHKDTSTTFVFDSLPLIYPTIINNHSTIVSQLKKLGVANISVEIAKQKQGFAGRLKLFKRNWENICTDRWVLHATQGYCIEWLNHPHQGHSPHCPRFSQEETESLEKEIKQMLEKQAISLVELRSEMQGFLSSIF